MEEWTFCPDKTYCNQFYPTPVLSGTTVNSSFLWSNQIGRLRSMTNEGKTIEKRNEKTWNVACWIVEKRGKSLAKKRAENGKETFKSGIQVLLFQR